MIIVKYRKIFYSISILLVLASIYFLISWGLKLGIDFKGGSILEVEYVNGRPPIEDIKKEISKLDFAQSVSLRPSQDKDIIIRSAELTDLQKESLISAISLKEISKENKSASSTSIGNVEVKRFNSIGPILGKEAVRKSYISIFLVILGIVLYITFVFRKVSKPVSSWKYGVITVVALVHDIIIPAGLFAVLGHVLGYEVDTLFVTALLVILGFSVHDTIVVFDRVRENLRKSHGNADKNAFQNIVGQGINQTFVRSINTSLTTLLALVALYVFGPDITRHFSLVLIVGIISGTYSSIFIASPLLVTVNNFQKKNK